MFTINTVLLGLRVANIALIEKLELDFDKGFSVFTGETGAGKSIFLEAIDSVLGGSNHIQTSRWIRMGSKTGRIEANFLITSSVEDWLKNNSFDYEDDEIFISREWKLKDNRLISRYRLNGEVVNKQLILQLRPLLVDFTVQGQVHQLSSSSKQLEWLDYFGSSKIQNKLNQVNQSWQNWNILVDKIKIFQKDLETNSIELEQNKYFLNDLNIANLEDPLEENQLKKDENRLLHGVNLQESIQKLYGFLKESNTDIPSILENLNLCLQELKSVMHLDDYLKNQYEKLYDIYSVVEDFIRDLDNYSLLLESDPEQLNFIQERLSQIQRLKSRYSLNLSQLIDKRNELRSSLVCNNFETKIKNLQDEETIFRSHLNKENQELSELRKAVALHFESLLIQYLKPLGLSNARFKVQIDEKVPSYNGIDKITFLFSANPGEPLAPLAEVASGGEMSRFLLALKRILAQSKDSAILIFDEIDSGVSGRVSKAIANVLKELSRYKQVFCVTHQPLVAAAADHHFAVSKAVENGKTESKVLKLKGFEQRKIELAELAGGDFEEASLYAASLLVNKAA